MRMLFIVGLISVYGVMAMEREPSTANHAHYARKKCQIKTWKEVSLFDCITSPWIPTALFATALTKETISLYRNNSSSAISVTKDAILAAPKFFFASSMLLMGCMTYSYYKPSIISLYKGIKGKFYEKKTCA